MKKILFTGLVVLALLLALPAAVSAAESDAVTVSGSIGGYIDVDVAAASLNFGSMVVGTPSTASTTLTVDSSYNSWGVDASATNGGKMQAGTISLTNLLDISNNAGSTWTTLATPFVDFFSGTAGVDLTKTVDVRQSITSSDPSGAYSITVTFTGGVN